MVLLKLPRIINFVIELKSSKLLTSIFGFINTALLNKVHSTLFAATVLSDIIYRQCGSRVLF